MALEDTGISVQDLKRVKNRVIGNPKAKETLVRDEGFMRRLVISALVWIRGWVGRGRRGKEGGRGGGCEMKEMKTLKTHV